MIGREDRVTRKARKDNKKVNFCPLLPVARIQDVFGENAEYLSCIAEDASTLSEVANTHRCVRSCVKYAKKGCDGQVLPGAQCRSGHGTDRRPLLPQGSVNNGKIRVHADGSVDKGNVRIHMDEHADQQPAQILEAEILRATCARKAARQAGQPPEADDDNCMVEVRRGSTHINSYNRVVQQCVRSNMDIKVILGNGDARGLVFYILMYTEQNRLAQWVPFFLSYPMLCLGCDRRGKAFPLLSVPGRLYSLVCALFYREQSSSRLLRCARSWVGRKA